jgi:glutamate racemase
MACNTSAACAYYEAIDAASVPIIDLIRPTASYASSLTNKVAVLATKSTVASRAFSTAIHAINPSVEVLELACPEFVSIVECGDLDSPTARQIVSSYAEYLKKQNVQSVVLGCTHFPFLSKALRSCLPNDLPIIDPAEILIDFLTGSTSIGSKTVDTKCDTSKTQLYVTGSPKTFEQIAQTCLGYLPGSVKGISVEELVAQEKQSGEINAKKVIMETDSTSILLPTFNT